MRIACERIVMIRADDIGMCKGGPCSHANRAIRIVLWCERIFRRQQNINSTGSCISVCIHDFNRHRNINRFTGIYGTCAEITYLERSSALPMILQAVVTVRRKGRNLGTIDYIHQYLVLRPSCRAINKLIVKCMSSHFHSVRRSICKIDQFGHASISYGKCSD